jgi:hypothetical protein
MQGKVEAAEKQNIITEVKTLDDYMGILDDRISILTDKLESVLLPEQQMQPTPEKEGNKYKKDQRPDHSPLREMIVDNRKLIISITNRIDYLIESIEL